MTTISLLGVPFDASSSFQRGAAAGPAAIRAALKSESTNTWNEDGQDVALLLQDAGDVVIEGAADPRAVIAAQVTAVLSQGLRPLILGGDHGITWPILRALRPAAPRLTIVHLDAHPDLYDEFNGDRGSHACPFARIMEERLCDHLVQLAIRTQNAPQLSQAERFGVQQVPLRAGFELMAEAIRTVTGPVYLSLDLDVLDPGCAPGVSHPEPGGLSTRELVSLVQQIPRGRLIGADLVELNPANDLRDLTARVAAKLVKEIAGRMGETMDVSRES